MKAFKLKIQGANLHNLLNTLINRKIKLKKVKFVDDHLLLDTNEFGSKKILSLYEKSSYNIEILQSPATKNNKEFLMRNIGILLSLLLFFLSIFFYGQHIWQFKIYGANLVNKQSIMQLLKENGVLIGAEKSELDFERIEKLLISQEGIALASVNIVGSTLIINISEKLNNDIFLNNEEPLVSKYDCIITDIKTISGTPLVKAGDKVLKGQKLVENWVKKENGEIIKSSAIAEITANCFFTYNKTFFSTETILTRSGNQKIVNEVFGFKSNKKVKYKNYEKQTNVIYLSNILPIKIKQTTYYEMQETTIENNLNDVDSLKTQAVEQAKQNLGIFDYDDLLISCEKNSENANFIITFVVNKKIA